MSLYHKSRYMDIHSLVTFMGLEVVISKRIGSITTLQYISLTYTRERLTQVIYADVPFDEAKST